MAPKIVPAADAEHEAGGDPRERGERVGLQLAGVGELDEGVEDHRRRRHQPAVGQPDAHGDFPAQREHDRQQQAERGPHEPREPRAFGAARSTAAGSAVAVMETRDITGSSKAMPQLTAAAAPFSAVIAGHDEFEAAASHHIPRQLVTVTWRSSIRSSSVFLTSTLAPDHARLLQRQAGLEDRIALRRADPVVGELGALLELLVDHRRRRDWSRR